MGHCRRQDHSRSWTYSRQIKNWLPAIWTDCHPPTDIGAQRYYPQRHDHHRTRRLSDGFIERLSHPEKIQNKCHYIPHHAFLSFAFTHSSHLKRPHNHPHPMLPLRLNGRYRESISPHQPGQRRSRCHAILLLSNPEDPESKFDVYRFKFILFGASCSSFILNATIKKHLNGIDHPVAQQMKINIYVDNLASGTDSEGETLTYLEQARSIMSPVGFHLRSWNSNNPKVRASAADQDLQDKDPETKVLGLRWNTNDQIRSNFNKDNHLVISTTTPPQKWKFFGHLPRSMTHLESSLQ